MNNPQKQPQSSNSQPPHPQPTLPYSKLTKWVDRLNKILFRVTLPLTVLFFVTVLLNSMKNFLFSMHAGTFFTVTQTIYEKLAPLTYVSFILLGIPLAITTVTAAVINIIYLSRVKTASPMRKKAIWGLIISGPFLLVSLFMLVLGLSISAG